MKTDSIQLKYKLKFITPFHCGTGLHASFINRTVVRDGGDNVYVPGSTFKGVVREQCEQLAHFYTLKDDSEMRPQIASSYDEKQALASLLGPVAMVERIFGSRNRPGLLFFDDARQYDDKEQEQSKDKYRSVQTDLCMQVPLDRLTRTAVPGALRTSEFGLKELVVYGSICGWLTCTALAGIEGEPSYSLLLLLAGLYMLAQLGGSKSIGKGQCVCEITRLSINNREFSNAVWLSWLEHLDMLMFYSEDVAVQKEGE